MPKHNGNKTEEIERTFYRNGRVFQEVPFQGGKINGLIHEWHRNGVLAKEVPMKDGLRHGVCKQWNDKGELLGTFEMNMGTGISKQWFPNGRLEFEASIVNESFTGRLRRWDEDGQLVQETFFLNNKTVPKTEYDRARHTDPSLPAYPEETGKARPVLAAGSNRRRGHERLIARLLSTRTANALKWLETSTANSTKNLGELSNAKSIALVTAFQNAGAVDVLAVDIDEDRKGNQHADKLVIVLPTDQKQRQAIRKMCVRRKLVVSPENETGHSHLAIFLG
jgi:hypothetical protein